MTEKALTLNDFKTFINPPYNDFRKVVERYSKSTDSDFKNDMEAITTLDFEKRLKKLGVNITCSKCNTSHINKIGKRNHIQVFRRKNCSTKFTAFSGTILEKKDGTGIYGLKYLK